MKTLKTNCIVCWKPVEVSFNPPIEAAEVHVECCEGPPKTRTTVLIIDDDLKILSVLAKMLKKFGFEVITANSKEQAFEQINSEKIFDLVISDLFIGKDDGLRLLYNIRKQRPSVKTILMSGSTLTKEETYCISINDFLAKPFELSKLKGTVKKVLEREVIL